MLLQQSGGDASQIGTVLKGVRAYSQAERPAPPSPLPEIARQGRAHIRDYGGTGRPVLFVPSLINAPDVLDLDENNSLLRWLAMQGVRPLLVDWGDPRDGGGDLSVAGHVEEILLPLMGTLGPDITLAGYCLGGTMAIAAAARARVAALVLIAAPWQFGGYPAEAREKLARLWQQSAPAADLLGLFPMEALQGAFWQIDPERTFAKFAAFGALEPGSPKARAFVRLEDWANQGPPLTRAAGRELLEDMYGCDLTGSGTWQVGGQAVDPASITAPILNIVSTTDRIVPAASAAAFGEHLVLEQGHVGMIVGSRARAALWEPLAAWLSHLRHS